MIDLRKTIYHMTKTWPKYENLKNESNSTIADFISKIYKKGIFREINRLLTCDIYDENTQTHYTNCAGIGHIVLIAICCAIDSLSAFASGGGKVRNRFTSFIARYFPSNYSGKESKIYEAFRCDSVHGWNLHKSSISGYVNDPKHLSEEGGTIYISLYDLFNDLNKAFDNYYQELKEDNTIKNNLLKRYKDIKAK